MMLKQPQEGLKELQKALRLNPKHAAAKAKLAETLVESRNVETVRVAERLSRELAGDSSQQANPDVLATLARAEMRLGNLADAEVKLRESVASFPENIRSASYLASAKLASNDKAGAEAVLRNLVAHNSRSTDARMALARFYMLAGNASGAQEQLRAVIDLEPRNPRALAALGQLLFASGKRGEAGPVFQSLSALPETEYRPFYSMYLFETGASAAGLQELERLHRTFGDDRNIRTRLIAAYLMLNRDANARRILGEALRKNPNDVDALLQRSRLELADGDAAGAESDLDHVLHFKPDLPVAHLLLARLSIGRGNSLIARQELTAALEADPSYLLARLELARILLASGDARASIAAVDRAPSAQHGEPDLVVQRNWALLRLADYAAVRKSTTAYLSRIRSPEMLIQSAIVNLDEGHPEVAQPLLKEVLRGDPGETRALGLLVRSYIKSHQPELALETLRNSLARRPQSAVLQEFAGEIFLALERRQEAHDAFRKAIAMNANFAPASLALARLQLQDGDLQGVRQILMQLLARKNPPVEAALMMADLEQRGGHIQAEIGQLRRAIGIEPENALALNEIAFRLADDLHRPDEALPFAQKAAELAPDNPVVEDTLGWVLYQKGLYQSAVRYLEGSVAKGKSPTRLLHLSLVYARLGRVQEASRARLDATNFQLVTRAPRQAK